MGQGDDIGEFTACIFDYHADHPELARLLLWEELSDAPAVHEIERTAHYRRTVGRLIVAQENGWITTEIDPAKLLFLLIAQAAWWFAVPQLARMVTGADGRDSIERAAQRLCVANAARQLATPRDGQRADLQNYSVHPAATHLSAIERTVKNDGFW